jgi:alpha-glucosidase (family GH31 glycosyl hydrolase)
VLLPLRLLLLLLLPPNARCLNAEHYDNTTEYDAHNLYGFAMAKQHYAAAVNVTGRRPFLLTRYA